MAIRLGRTMEHDALRISCLAAGISFIAVNPEYPGDRAAEIIAACDPRLVIADSDLDEVRSSEPERIFDRGIADDCEGYIVFTSGSTGKPKGVVHGRDLFLSA